MIQPRALARLSLWLALLFAALSAAPASAQIPGTTKADGADSAPADLYGRTSPRGLVDGLIGALAAKDYDRVTQYFDLSALPRSQREAQGASRARQLESALNAGGTLIQPVSLSNDASGRIDDQLPPEQERIGTLRAADGKSDVPLIASRVERDGGAIWLISTETLAQLRALRPTADDGDALRDKLPPVLKKATIAGAPLADWLLLLGVAIFFYLVVRVAASLVLALVSSVHPLKRESWFCRVLANAPAPFSLWLGMLLFLATTRTLEAAIVARQFASRIAGALAFLAFCWLVWRLIDIAAELVAARMERSQRYRARSIIIFTRRALKLLLLLFAAVQALNILGIDVTTGIAALGLGGLAIALGAQKTVENVVGSVSVVVDEPVRVGDFCKVGDVAGTVEEIGIRSTRIRTNDRTRITIPNSNFASQQIENFADRDRFLFAPVLRLAYGIDADTIERVLEAVRGVLADADYLFPGVRANFKGFGENSLDIEIFGWINRSNFDEVVLLQEKLLLNLMRQVEAAGASLVPTRTVMFGKVPMTED